ncbi:hypothetical protein [Arthrobacter sp. ISL-65]|uniref:hypothetical protein n=1 Tax=Arthrobacter sp. ISL-65 TaxID=2819112 RepID=UPI001BED0AEB|nr:hypothetical protein [Arthrobacter sp. ISL-65]MBT2547468.1 hypothetical protein [Arthrobacter sp. ISL-65]
MAKILRLTGPRTELRDNIQVDPEVVQALLGHRDNAAVTPQWQDPNRSPIEFRERTTVGALTQIKLIRNNSPYEAQVEQNEAGKFDVVPANGGSIPYDDRVPWAATETEFYARHMAVRLRVPDPKPDIVWAIWQRNVDHDDRVRASRNEEIALWADPGAPIAGRSEVRGSRAIYIDSSGDISMDATG